MIFDESWDIEAQLSREEKCRCQICIPIMNSFIVKLNKMIDVYEEINKTFLGISFSAYRIKNMFENKQIIWNKDYPANLPLLFSNDFFIF